MSEVHAFFTDDKLRAALADPALENLADGPAKDLFGWLAVNTGQYGATYTLRLVSERQEPGHAPRMTRFWRWWKGPLHTSSAVIGLLSMLATVYVIAYLVVAAANR